MQLTIRAAAVLFLAIATTLHVVAAQPTTAAVPLDAIDAIIDAFGTHEIVALSETHADERQHAFRLALIRDPRFSAVANDIVVEFGNSLYQDTVDRFTSGAAVPADELNKVWQNTTQGHTIWDRPIYEDFFRAVRTINQAVPASRRLRVLLGDPPMDWDAVRTPDDVKRLKTGRSSHPAEIVGREVLAKKRRALINYGSGHLFRENAHGPNLIEHVERAQRVRAFVVVESTDLDVLGIDAASVRPPAVALTKGTSLERQADAILYLGPSSGRRVSPLSASLCADASYRAMRVRRMTLSGHSNAADLLARECSAAAAQGRPDFSGVWKPVEPVTAAAPPPPTSPSGPPPPPRTVSITIAQSSTEMRNERRLESAGRETTQTFTYKLDGTESVNQMGPLVFRTKAAWDGPRLVLTSTVFADDKPIGEVKDVYRLEDGRLVIETTRKTPAGTFSSKTLHRKE